MLRHRYVRTKQAALIYFISDHDPSGHDLQRAWEEALKHFFVRCFFVRVGLTKEQVEDPDLGLVRLSIEVKPSDSRSKSFIEQYGDRCWEADVLPAAEIEAALNSHIEGWLDTKKWKRRAAEIEQARKLL
jgi:hypothetical protein